MVLIFLLNLFVQEHVLPGSQPSLQFLCVKKWPSNYVSPKSFITQAQVLISLASSTSLAIQTIDPGSDTGYIALILALM
jgi:hypothetical protein